MSKQLKVTFTASEVEHIRSVMYRNEREGEYFGNPKHSWKRSRRILDKLNEAETPDQPKADGGGK